MVPAVRSGLRGIPWDYDVSQFAHIHPPGSRSVYQAYPFRMPSTVRASFLPPGSAEPGLCHQQWHNC